MGGGEPKGEAVEDLVRLKVVGTKPGGASGLTPKRGELDNGVPEPRQEAGDGRRSIVCRMGGGEVALPPPSRYLHNASRTAFSSASPRQACLIPQELLELVRLVFILDACILEDREAELVCLV